MIECIANTMPVEAQARPSAWQVSATSETVAPSPPSSVGTSRPSSRSLRAAAKASAGNLAPRSTASACAAATRADRLDARFQVRCDRREAPEAQSKAVTSSIAAA